MYEIFERLCKEKGITPTQVARETGVPQTTLSNWKKRRNYLNTTAAQKIANYFGVSLEYLMTGKDTPALLYTDIEMGEFNDEVRKLIEVLNNADIDTVRRLRYYAEGLLAARRERKHGLTRSKNIRIYAGFASIIRGWDSICRTIPSPYFKPNSDTLLSNVLSIVLSPSVDKGTLFTFSLAHARRNAVSKHPKML